MKYNAYDTVTAVVKSWTSKARSSNIRSTKRNSNFASMPAYKSIRKYEKVGAMLGIKSPFFRAIGGRVGNSCIIDGRKVINFAWCDYLGLNQHPSLAAAAAAATDEYGTCVSASRLVAGETLLHAELEREIASFLGVEEALLFVSGHAANVSTISTVVGDGDLIVHDEFVHNSAVLGARLSGAAVRTFAHNNLEALENILHETRTTYQNVLIIVEGLYSTEGDVPDLSRLIELKQRFGAWLMVDDAHGLGILGATGRGCAEHCGIEPKSVDIWMGTLSKTLASCGGFIAGSRALVDVLRYAAPGFVYSVGLPPAMTAAALAALRVMKAEPERVERLRANGRFFLREAASAGLNTGNSRGLGMLPVIAGDVIATVKLWHKVFDGGINSSLIVYPGVPLKGGRLRFFLTSEHSEDQIRLAIGTTSACLRGDRVPEANRAVASMKGVS
jgi:8-amino-7-oxononanoate synthase